MPKYIVRKAHDAYFYYKTTVEAPSPEDAALIASSDFYDGKWKPDGHTEFDDCDIIAIIEPSSEELPDEDDTM